MINVFPFSYCLFYIALVWEFSGTEAWAAPQLDIQPASPFNFPADTQTPWYEGRYTNEGGVVGPDTSMPFRLFAPRGYDFSTPGDEVRHPLIVFMHGAGERSNNTIEHIVALESLSYWATEVAQALSPTGGAFVVAPKITARDEQWTDHPIGPPGRARNFNIDGYSADSVPVSDSMELSLELVAGLLDGGDNVDLDFQTRIDPSRVYIVGTSMGGFAVWDALGRVREFPSLLPEEYGSHQFAGAVSSSGAGPTDRGADMVDVPIWAIRHDRDETVPPAGTGNMIAAIETAGGEPFFETLPVLSSEAFSTDLDTILSKKNLLTRFQGRLPRGFPASRSPVPPKNVIMMIGDGMGFEQVRAAGMVLNGEAGTLNFESFPSQASMMTSQANALPTTDVTDSAAAGTAIATGVKVDNAATINNDGNNDGNYTLVQNRDQLGTMEFANAVQEVLDWASINDPDFANTLIIVTSDHETGGLMVTETNPVAGEMPSVTWAGIEHTKVDVPLAAIGPNSGLISGVMDNTDLFAVVTVPEPSTVTLFLFAGLSTLAASRRRTS